MTGSPFGVTTYVQQKNDHHILEKQRKMQIKKYRICEPHHRRVKIKHHNMGMTYLANGERPYCSCEQ